MAFERYIKKPSVLHIPPDWHDDSMLASLRDDISKWLSEDTFRSTSKMERARLRAALRKGKQDARSC